MWKGFYSLFNDGKVLLSQSVSRSEDVHGISVAYKATCSVVHSSMVYMVEGKQLVAESQDIVITVNTYIQYNR